MRLLAIANLSHASRRRVVDWRNALDRANHQVRRVQARYRFANFCALARLHTTVKPCIMSRHTSRL